jgi:hypothetical protein
MRQEKIKAIIFTSILFGGLVWWLFGMPGINSFISKATKSTSHNTSNKDTNSKSKKIKTGTIIDSYKGVNIYYNGRVSHVNGRNKTKDGYNLGLNYQCVEFAKRFFYERYNHKMPDSYGHAKDFYNAKYKHGSINKERNMYQYKNRGSEKPKVNDLIVIGPSSSNRFGHLVVVTKVNKNEISFIQQNPGPKNPSRGKFRIDYNNGIWSIKSNDILGWLRLK